MSILSNLFSSTNQTIRTILIILCLIGMVFVQGFGLGLDDAVLNRLLESSLIRILGGTAFLLILWSLGYTFVQFRAQPMIPILIIMVPGILVAVNNLPIIAMVRGFAQIDAPSAVIWAFVLDCLSIGLFEEVVFRGVILIVLLQRLPQTKEGVLQAVFLSSAVFAFVHILNLFAGAGPLDTLLQVGYSFLMGLLWSVVFLLTKSIWPAVLLHAIYNFTGLFFVTLGRVTNRYDVVTIVLTVGLGLYAAWFYYQRLQQSNLDDTITLATPQS